MLPFSLAGQADPWSRRRARKAARLARIAPWMKGHVLETGAIVEALQTLLEPGDAVALEGDNQKQADFLSRSLVQVDPAKIHDLHLLISSISRPEHLTLFDRGIARKVDFCLRRSAERTPGASCSRTASSRSAPFTPMSSCTLGCSWT